MSVGLDTSVTLRLLTGAPAAQAEQARAALAGSAEPAAVSDLVVGETYFALRHHYGVPEADVLRALHALLSDPKVRGAGAAPAVVAELAGRPGRARPALMDRLIHADYQRDALVVLTFDRELAALPGARRPGDA